MQVDSLIWYHRCVSEHCAAEVDGKEAQQAVLCEYLSAFGRACSEMGKAIEWRSEELCRKSSTIYMNNVLGTFYRTL